MTANREWDTMAAAWRGWRSPYSVLSNALQRNGVRFSDYYDTSFTVTIKAKEN